VGKFLLDLEESSVPMKLVENLSTIDAQNIKKNLEGEGATITIEFYN
jgi:ribosomal protein L7/L12